MKHALEKNKLFPFIAWAAFIGFVIFVFYLATELQSSTTTLSDRTEQNLKALDDAP